MRYQLEHSTVSSHRFIIKDTRTNKTSFWMTAEDFDDWYARRHDNKFNHQLSISSDDIIAEADTIPDLIKQVPYLFL